MKRKITIVIIAFTTVAQFLLVPQAFADGATESGQVASPSGIPVAGSGDILNGMLLSVFAIVFGFMIIVFSRKKSYQ